MAPNLGASKIEAANMMMTTGEHTAAQMANVIDCHERTIRRLGTNKRLFGSVKAPLRVGGRCYARVSIEGLCDQLAILIRYDLPR